MMIRITKSTKLSYSFRTINQELTPLRLTLQPIKILRGTKIKGEYCSQGITKSQPQDVNIILHLVKESKTKRFKLFLLSTENNKKMMNDKTRTNSSTQQTIDHTK